MPLSVLSAPGGQPPYCPGPSLIIVNDLLLVLIPGIFVQICTCQLYDVSIHHLLHFLCLCSLHLIHPGICCFSNTDLISIPPSWYHMPFPWSRPSPSLLLSGYSCICPVNRFLCMSHVPSSLFMQCNSNKNLFMSLPSLLRTQSKSPPQRSEHWHLLPRTPSSLCLRCDCRSPTLSAQSRFPSLPHCSSV